MIYVFLADGFEETEAIAPVDVMRRAGLEVKTVGVTGKTVTSSHSVPVTADIIIDEALGQDADAVVLPGGMPGTVNLDKSPAVRDMVLNCYEQGKIVAAICAAPSVLGHLGILDGVRATCFPGFEGELGKAVYDSSGVVADGNIITGKGAGAALQFGEAIAAKFVGEDSAHDVLVQMQTQF